MSPADHSQVDVLDKVVRLHLLPVDSVAAEEAENEKSRNQSRSN